MATPFTIRRRVHRSETDVVGIRMSNFREGLATAVEAASVVPYTLFLNGNASADTFAVGFTPGMGAKAYELYIKTENKGSDDTTVDVQVDGTSIIEGGAVTLDANTVFTPALTAAAKASLAAGKRITVVTTVGATPAVDVVVGLHLKTVHNAA